MIPPWNKQTTVSVFSVKLLWYQENKQKSKKEFFYSRIFNRTVKKNFLPPIYHRRKLRKKKLRKLILFVPVSAESFNLSEDALYYMHVVFVKNI